MIRNFKGKSVKDIEPASETIILSKNFTNSILNKINVKTNLVDKSPQAGSENLESDIEKRK